MTADRDNSTSYLADRPVLSRLQSRLVGVAGPLAIASLALLLPAGNWIDRLENTSIDWRFSVRGPRTPRSDIVIVEIGEASRQALADPGHEFNLRQHLPAAIDHLADAGAAVIGLDFFMTRLTRGEVDEPLADAIGNADVILAVTHTDGRTMRWAPTFTASQPAEGAISVYPDADGVLRRLPPILNLDLVGADGSVTTALHFPLMAAIYELFAPGEAPRIEIADGGRTVRLGDRTVQGGALIDFAAQRGGAWRTMTFRDAVTGEFDSQSVSGAIVLIGESRSIADTHPMPLSNVRVPGVYYHANVIDQILGGYGFDESFSQGWRRLVLLGGLTLAAGLFAWNQRAWWRHRHSVALLALYLLAGVAVFLGGWAWASFAMFNRGKLLPCVAPLVGMTIALGTGFAVQWLVLSANARRLMERALRIEALFGQSVSQNVLAALKSDPGRIMGRQVRDVSVLFCDIRGFTAKAADVSPEQTAGMLNEYFEHIAPAIFQHDGFIDKFVGDEVMVVFSVPLPQEDHAVRAVRTAVEMKRRLAELNTIRKARGEAALDCGIGIHTGPAAAGHIGSQHRSNYTVVGTSVNVAARIEGFTKGGEILISSAVESQLPAEIPRRPWRRVEIAGMSGRHDLHVIDVRDGSAVDG